MLARFGQLAKYVLIPVILSLHGFAICRESVDLEHKYALIVAHTQTQLCAHKSQRITCEWNRRVKAVNSLSRPRLYP